MRAAGIVLCGGKSSRMGTPKAWLPFGGELLLPRVVRVVSAAVGAVVVVAAPGQEVPPLPPNVRVVRDEVEGRGPLAGLCAGLAALEGEADVAYLSSCDAPLLTAAFVRTVVGALGPTPPGPPSLKGRGETEPPRIADVFEQSKASSPLPFREGGPGGVGPLCAVPHIHGRLHPLAAAYTLAALAVARAQLAAGRLRMTDLLDRLAARRIEAHELPDLDSLRNVNTPDEYAAALRDLRTS